MCPCLRGPKEWWMCYPPIYYLVCTECMHKRLDAADHDPVLEPEEIVRYSVTRIMD